MASSGSVLYALSLHDALPICSEILSSRFPYRLYKLRQATDDRSPQTSIPESDSFLLRSDRSQDLPLVFLLSGWLQEPSDYRLPRSEEHTSELQSRFDLVCRLL